MKTINGKVNSEYAAMAAKLLRETADSIEKIAELYSTMELRPEEAAVPIIMALGALRMAEHTLMDPPADRS